MRSTNKLAIGLFLLDFVSVCWAEGCTTIGDCTAKTCNTGYDLICQQHTGSDGLMQNGGLCTCRITTERLCEGPLVDSGVGFNHYPKDCTKFVQCWTEGEVTQYLIRSCPFGQFWDSDAITCRPSFLVTCTADPCRNATFDYTYKMAEYGCRSYWKCVDGASVGHCCTTGSAYTDGMGCLETSGCNDACPPCGGMTAQGRSSRTENK